MPSSSDRGPPDVNYTFDSDRAAASGARRALRRIVGEGSFGDDVRLAASELVTNVVLHTDNGGRMHAWDTNPLRLEVHDTSPLLPSKPLHTNGGRGLAILGAVSSAWGANATPQGKLVWAEFERPSADAAITWTWPDRQGAAPQR